MLLLCKLLADFNETWFKIILGSWGTIVVVFHAYIAYISIVIFAYIFPTVQLITHLSTLMLRPCDYDVTIVAAPLLNILLLLYLWTNFTHHYTSIIIKSISFAKQKLNLKFKMSSLECLILQGNRINSTDRL